MHYLTLYSENSLETELKQYFNHRWMERIYVKLDMLMYMYDCV